MGTHNQVKILGLEVVWGCLGRLGVRFVETESPGSVVEFSFRVRLPVDELTNEYDQDPSIRKSLRRTVRTLAMTSGSGSLPLLRKPAIVRVLGSKVGRCKRRCMCAIVYLCTCHMGTTWAGKRPSKGPGIGLVPSPSSPLFAFPVLWPWILSKTFNMTLHLPMAAWASWTTPLRFTLSTRRARAAFRSTSKVSQ